MPVTANIVKAASVYNAPLVGKLLKLKLATVPSLSVPVNTTGIELASSLPVLLSPVATGGLSFALMVVITDAAPKLALLGALMLTV